MSINMEKHKDNEISVLSESAWKITRKYIHHEKQENWLFPGQEKKRHLTGQTVQKVFEEGEGQGCDSKTSYRPYDSPFFCNVLTGSRYGSTIHSRAFLAITVREPRSIIHMLVKVELDAL